MKNNSKTIGFILLFILLLPFESCIEPIIPDLNENDSEPLLVVAGQITDEEGPFTVKLTTSVPVNVMYYPIPVLGADVRIIDDIGNSYQLLGNKNGLYETADKKLKGIPGNTYYLSITTSDGVQYESSPAFMQDVPDVDSLYFEEVKHIRLENGLTYEDNWLNILVDIHDPEGITEYWRFEYEETWEVLLLTDDVPVNHSLEFPDYRLEKVVVSDEKKVCWVTKPSGSIMLAKTTNGPLDEIKRLPLHSLGPGKDKLHIRYSILVKQSSLNHEMYSYWKQLMDSNENLGGMYDKNPAQVNGNISCCNGTSKALGYFAASAIKKKRLFIEINEHHIETVSPYKGCGYFDYGVPNWVPKEFFGTIEGTSTRVYSSGRFCADCRDYGSNIKPDFW